MGIADFKDIQEESLTEKLLVISKEEKLAERITDLTKTRSYQISRCHTLTDANDSEEKTLYDLVIYETDPNRVNIDLSDVISTIRSDFRRNRCPTLIVSKIESIIGTSDDLLGIEVVSPEIDDPDLLFAVSKLLRLHRVKAKRASVAGDIALENASLRDLTNRFRKELTEARKIQNSILPSSLPENKGFRFGVFFEPLEGVGGDLYDIWNIDDESYGMLVADVVGHGLSASMIGMMVKMSQYYSIGEAANPASFLKRMNSGLSTALREGKFATACYASINPKRNLVSVALAGHMAALLHKKATGEVIEVGGRGFALGMIPGSDYEAEEVKIDSGDRLYMYTDGVSEAQNMDNKMWGTEGLVEAVKESASKDDIEQALTHIRARHKSWAGGRLVKDDITILGFSLDA